MSFHLKYCFIPHYLTVGTFAEICGSLFSEPEDRREI